MRIARTKRGAVPVAALFVIVGIITACGAGAGMASAPSAAPAANELGGASTEFYDQAARAGAPQGQDGEAAAFNDGALIIRTGSLQLEVTDSRAAIAEGRSAILGLGGYIGASQQYVDGEDVVATITYRIPADRWEDALEALRKLGKPISEQTDAADVTGQIVDLDARIRNLRASETALVSHLSAAAKVSDILEIEDRLSVVRGEIEQLTAQKAHLDDQVAYATLTATYGVEIAAVTAAAEQWDAKSEVDRAGASLLGFLQFLASAGIWLAIVGLPIVAVAAVVIGLALFALRRFGVLRRIAGPPPPAAVEG
jgi:hypothetical protein